MKYELIYSHRAEKDIKRLEPMVRNRLDKALLQLNDNPPGCSEELTNPKIGSYRFRMGDYRVIFDIEGKDIVILRVGHRKEIYKRL